MNNITIATFLSNVEKFNNDFLELIEYLEKDFNIEIIIFCEKKIENLSNDIKQIVTPNMTKYKRIEMLINVSQNDNILCVDNDMIVNKENIEKFIKEIINTDYAIAWGKVKTQNIVGFIPHLIKIDKNLSHDFIRPFLWKFDIGISVPGQIFLISKKYYLNKFHTIDTVYDDLTLGIIAKSNKMPVYFNNYILGYETPKGNFKDLLKQRRRWAKGLAESIYNNRNSKSLKYVKIHGFMYHFLWIVYYLIILFCSLINYRIGIIIFLLTGLILSEFKLKDLIYGYAYLLIFPIIHLFWLKSFIKNFKILYKK